MFHREPAITWYDWYFTALDKLSENFETFTGAGFYKLIKANSPYLSKDHTRFRSILKDL